MARRDRELDDMDLDGLLDELAMAKDSFLRLRIRNATGQLDNTAELRATRRHIARINTYIRQREIAAAEAEEASRG